MAWFKIDDLLHGHPKTRKADLPAMGLWAVAGSYAMAYKLDGHIDAEWVASWRNGTKLAARLVQAGFWHPAGHDCHECPQPRDDGGWVFHNWADFQPSTTEIEKTRAAARERQAAHRQRRRQPDGTFGKPSNIHAM